MRGGFARAYTPAKTVATEATVRHFASEAMNGDGPMDGPVWLSVAIYQRVPVSWSKKKQAAALYVTGKPDLDNILKLLGDSCNGILWQDDSQICDLHIFRRYIQGEQERVEVSVRNATDAGWLARRETERAA